MKTTTAFLIIPALVWQPLSLRGQGILQLAGSPPSSVAPQDYYSSVFDGTDNLSIATELGGLIADGQMGLLSVWLKMGAGSSDTATYYLFQNGTLANRSFLVFRSTDGAIWINGFTSVAASCLLLKSSANACVIASGWVHVLASWDLSTSLRRRVYIDGVDQTVATTFTIGSTIDYAKNAAWGVMATSAGQNKTPALVSEFYFTNTYLDLSVTANRDKFFNSVTGKPTDLGVDGSTPTGAVPLIYLANPYNTFQTNLGSGGNFTVTGTIGDGGADIP